VTTKQKIYKSAEQTVSSAGMGIGLNAILQKNNQLPGGGCTIMDQAVAPTPKRM